MIYEKYMKVIENIRKVYKNMSTQFSKTLTNYFQIFKFICNLITNLVYWVFFYNKKSIYT